MAASATQTPGTWWDDWTAWLDERSGAERRARSTLARGRYKPLGRRAGDVRL